MAEDLKQYLAEHRCKGFRALPHYFPEEDYVTYFHRDERSYSKRIDGLLTVYLSMETHQLIGCKIKGVRHFLQNAGDFGVMIQDHTIKMGFFFLMGKRVATEERTVKLYEELAELAKDVELNIPMAG